MLTKCPDHPAPKNADLSVIGERPCRASREHSGHVRAQARLLFQLVWFNLRVKRAAKRGSESPLKDRARRFVTFLVVAGAIIGFVAWYMINKDSLGESFGAFRELFRYVSFHAR
jgi:hypothetical protein